MEFNQDIHIFFQLNRIFDLKDMKCILFIISSNNSEEDRLHINYYL